MSEKPLGFTGRLAAAFIESRLTPLLIVMSLLLGIGATLILPREEEPQIVVPMADVMTRMPGASAAEVEQRVTLPMEKLIREVSGVEYVYSTSRPGQSLIIVRFYVGENPEGALVRLYNKLYSNGDRVPPGVAWPPLIKARSIDDVPILALTLHGPGHDGYELRQVAAQVDEQIKQVPDVSETELIGGQNREVRVELTPSRLAAFRLGPSDVVRALGAGNVETDGAPFERQDRALVLRAGDFLQTAAQVAGLVVATHDGRPVFLRDVAQVIDGPEEPRSYVFFGTARGGDQEAVTIAVSKRRGANAITVSHGVLDKLAAIRAHFLPAGVSLDVTRDYGETAAERSNELLVHMGIAVVSVVALMWLALGKRESVVVAIAIPVTLALTVCMFVIYGFTLNRVTFFALIFSIGILVDDAIVVVENVVRHLRMPENHGRDARTVVIEAVDEVGNPTILATLTVMGAILPMAFVGGLMGPYMRPIPLGASAAMLFSMLVAFTIIPWAALRILGRGTAEHVPEGDDALTRLYRHVMGPLIHHRGWRALFLFGTVGLLLGSLSLVGFRLVLFKMLPFDNKSEFQVLVNMPEGSTLERTAAVTREIESFVARIPEVIHYQGYVGTASPYNFNGLVRHYFLRSGPNVADVQVNLLPKGDRRRSSHDIAKAARPGIRAIAERYGATVQVAEIPPGPPVLQTLVTEVYGPSREGQIALARGVKQAYRASPGVVDVDWYMEHPQPLVRLHLDREKAAQTGLDPTSVAQALQTALDGTVAGLLHDAAAREPVPLRVRFAHPERNPDGLRALQLPGRDGLVSLDELLRVQDDVADPSIYHKNMQPVVYVIGDVAADGGGGVDSPLYSILDVQKRIDRLQAPDGRKPDAWYLRQPDQTEKYAVKWDGEWQVTYEVMRDLGIAFAVVMVLIYALIVGWFQNFWTPLVIVSAIPFSMVGIMPGHWGLHAFFTATSMIGFIAGAGIVVRNSIILVDFIELRLRQGMPLDEAVVDAGAVRFRPMLLTAAAVVTGSFVILADPIFNGLAISLMAGEVASLLLSRSTVPVLYYLLWRGRKAVAAVALVGLVLWTAAPATAETAVVHLSLDEAVRRGVAASPSLDAARWKRSGAEAAVAERRGAGRPQVDLAAGYTFLTPTLSFAGLPIQVTDNWNAGVAVRQALVTFGRMHWDTLAAYLAARAAAAEEAQARQDAVLEIRLAYARCLLAEEAERITAQRVVDETEHQRVAKVRFDAGAVPRFEVISLQAALGEAREAQVAARNERRVTQSRLLSLLGLPLDQALALDPLPALLTTPAGGIDSWSRNPRLATLRWAVEAARARVEGARASNRPRLDLEAGYARRTATGFSTPDLFTAGVALRVPLSDGGQTRARVAQAAAALHEQEAAYEAGRRAVALEVQEAWLALDSARERIEASGLTLARATEARRAAELRYRGGVSAPVELLDAQTAFTRAEVGAAQAAYAYRMAYWSWLHATGAEGELESIKVHNSSTSGASTR